MWFLLLLMSAAPQPAGPYSWLPYKDGSGDLALMSGDRHCGNWHADKGEFRPRDPVSGQWGSVAEPPIPPPMLNFGLIETNRPERDKFTTPAGEIPAAEALAQLGDDGTPNLPDDGTRRRVVVIGTDQQTAQVKGEWLSAGALAPWRDAVTFQSMAPGDWRIEGTGFQTNGAPVIYYLAPDGTVLHRQDDFAGGAAALAEALRDADESYDRLLDPDRRAPWNRWLARVQSNRGALLAAVALVVVVAAYLVTRKGK